MVTVTLFGSCRQDSIHDDYTVTNIRNGITYPHYTEEILQAIRAIKGKLILTADECRWLFRTGMLERRAINPTNHRHEFDATDVFVLEIASRKTYKWNNNYAHHIITEEKYGFPYIDDIIEGESSDEEIERGLLEIKAELDPKPMIVVSHMYSYTHGKRYELTRLLQRLCLKHRIAFLDPMIHFQNRADKEDFFENDSNCTHYTKCGHQLIRHIYKQCIDKPRHWNTAVFVWAQKACNRNADNYWGIGDIVRGLAYTYMLCKRINVNLFVDFSQHPISKLISRHAHPYHAYVDSKCGQIPFIEGRDVENTINSAHLPIFMTNGEMYKEDLPHECKVWIRSLFSSYSPPDLPTKFTALHIRLGDHHMISDSKHDGDKISVNGDYTKAYELYKSHVDDNTILFSDSKKFKEYIKSRDPSARMFDIEIAHLGIMDNTSGIEGTLREYLTLSKATSIKTYSTYSWISGFVQSVSLLFDVPIINLKKV
jgi:hypothetical protein